MSSGSWYLSSSLGCYLLQDRSNNTTHARQTWQNTIILYGQSAAKPTTRYITYDVQLSYSEFKTSIMSIQSADFNQVIQEIIGTLDKRKQPLLSFYLNEIYWIYPLFKPEFDGIDPSDLNGTSKSCIRNKAIWGKDYPHTSSPEYVICSLMTSSITW